MAEFGAGVTVETAPEQAGEQRKAVAAASAPGGAKNPAVHKPNGDFAKGNPHAFKPGQTGNPKGRPKKDRSVTEQLIRGITAAKAKKIATNLIRTAMREDADDVSARDSLAAVGIVLDRTDGPLNQVTTHRIEHVKVIRRIAGDDAHVIDAELVTPPARALEAGREPHS